MPTKLKITLGALLLIAGFLVLRVGLYFKHSVQTANSIQVPSVLSAQDEDPLEHDSDSDGLSDRDEIIYATDLNNKDTDGDGYIDGEEIVSGYDPLDPNSNSQTTNKAVGLISSSANLTDRVLNLGVASLITDSGELDPEQMTNNKFADIMQSINNEAALTLNPRTLTDWDIKITEDNSVESIQKYLRTIGQMLEEGLFSASATINDPNIMNGVLGISGDNRNYYQEKYESLKIIEAPSSWKEIHKTALQDLYKLALASRALTDKAIDEDPVRASFAASNLQQAFLDLHNLLNQASTLAKSQNISTNDSILNILQSTKTSLP